MNKLMYIKLQRGSGNVVCQTCYETYDKDEPNLLKFHTDGKCKCATPNCMNQPILITGQEEHKKHRFHPIQTWDETLCIECNLGVKCDCKDCKESESKELYPVNLIVFRFEPNADGDHIQKNLYIEHQIICNLCGKVDKDGVHCCSGCEPAL